MFLNSTVFLRNYFIYRYMHFVRACVDNFIISIARSIEIRIFYFIFIFFCFAFIIFLLLNKKIHMTIVFKLNQRNYHAFCLFTLLSLSWNFSLISKIIFQCQISISNKNLLKIWKYQNSPHMVNLKFYKKNYIPNKKNYL